MKYIQRYIKTLADGIIEKKSEISNSVYYKLTGKDGVDLPYVVATIFL